MLCIVETTYASCADVYLRNYCSFQLLSAYHKFDDPRFEGLVLKSYFKKLSTQVCGQLDRLNTRRQDD